MRDLNDEPLTIGENTYLIDTTDASLNKADASRLIEQDELVNDGQKSLVPDDYEPHADSAILDIACGPGGWLREVHHLYPHVRLVGVDNNKPIIEWARRHKKTQHNPNVSFELMDVMQPLEFPDASFDFINARFLAGVVTHEHWAILLRDCFRILKPGGFIRLTESELSWIANAPAAAMMTDAMLKVIWKRGRTYSPTALAIAPMLSYFLTQSGFVDPDTQIIGINWSFNMPQHSRVRNDTLMTAQILRDQFVELGIMTNAEFEELDAATKIETEQEEFAALWPIANCVARKSM